MKKLVVFASGYGSNFQAVIDAVERNEIKADMAGLIAGRENIHAIERARKHAIPWTVLHPGQFAGYDEYTEALIEQLREWSPDLIILAGYLLKIPEKIVDAYDGRIINIHPSLLPKYSGKGYYGLRVHQAVLDHGEKVSGCTVHFVDPEYDTGPVIDQVIVPVLKNDTAGELSKRIREKELELLPAVVAKLVNDEKK